MKDSINIYMKKQIYKHLIVHNKRNLKKKLNLFLYIYNNLRSLRSVLFVLVTNLK